MHSECNECNERHGRKTWHRVSDFIRAHGRDGFRVLGDRYRDPDQPSWDTRDAIAVAAAIQALLDENEPSNRTLIFEQLLGFQHPNPLIEELKDLTGKRSAGEMTWDEYRASAAPVVRKLAETEDPPGLTVRRPSG